VEQIIAPQAAEALLWAEPQMPTSQVREFVPGQQWAQDFEPYQDYWGQDQEWPEQWEACDTPAEAEDENAPPNVMQILLKDGPKSPKSPKSPVKPAEEPRLPLATVA